jgi:hypothetical protein
MERNIKMNLWETGFENGKWMNWLNGVKLWVLISEVLQLKFLLSQ